MIAISGSIWCAPRRYAPASRSRRSRPRLAPALGIEAAILPATDDRLRTWIDTPAGSFPFQEWFVARGHRDEVDAVRFVGEARPAPGVLEPWPAPTRS